VEVPVGAPGWEALDFQSKESLVGAPCFPWSPTDADVASGGVVSRGEAGLLVRRGNVNWVELGSPHLSRAAKGALWACG
jgi:hypothetical protein